MHRYKVYFNGLLYLFNLWNIIDETIFYSLISYAFVNNIKKMKFAYIFIADSGIFLINLI